MKSKTKKIFQKLGKASLSEALFRMKEELIKLGEKSKLSKIDDDLLVKLNLSRTSIEDLADYYKKRAEPKFFIDDEDKKEFLNVFADGFPQSKEQSIEEADLVCQGKYDIFSYSKLDWGRDVDWHLDKVNNKKAPLVFWDEVGYLDFNSAGDSKITWEINRHQHFLTLGKAYWHTKDEKYAEEFVKQVGDWINKNPVNMGINWVSSLELALRINSWIWGFYFFRESKAFDGKFICKMLNSIYHQAKHIQNHLSYYFSPNTHLIGEGFGLFLVGMFFPEFKEAKEWQKIGLRILIDEMKKQTREDGVHVEQSTYYHYYTADFYLQVLILTEKNGISLPSFFRPKLEMMLEFVMYITKPDGKAPMIGDADGGRVCPIEKRDVNDYCSILSTAAVVFGRGDFKFVAGDLSEETIWLLGKESIEDYQKIEQRKPNQSSKYFKNSGFLVMRSGWEEKDKYLIFDAGPFGWKDCGHSHDDFASFELAIGKQNFTQDIGTYCYTLDKKWRDYFRESRAHNVVLIDNENRSQAGDIFEWQSRAEGKPEKVITTENFDFVSTIQKINLKSGQSFLHQRRVIFIKPEYWVIEDSIWGGGEHNLEILFHLGRVEILLSESDKTITLVGENDTSLLIMPLEKNDINLKLEKGWASENYGEKTSSSIVNFYGRFYLPISLITILYPTEKGSDKIELSSIHSTDDKLEKIFKIQKTESTDYFICSSRNVKIENPIVSSDAQVGFIRADKSDKVIKSFLIEGSYLKFKDKAILNNPGRISYLEL